VATTRRKTTVLPDAQQTAILDRRGGWFNHLTISNLSSQDGRNGVLPIPFEALVPSLVKVAQTAANLHARWDGSTVNVAGANLAGLPLYAVATYPKRAAEFTIQPSWELIFAYAVINADLLFLPDHALGTWFDQRGNLHVADIVQCIPDLHEALTLGQRYMQQFIFDLKRMREVEVPPRSRQRSRREQS
jgi:hypothetical protein